MVNKVTGTHKPGEYIIYLDVANQGRLAEIGNYYQLQKAASIDIVLCRGLASLLIQIRQEKAQAERSKDTKDNQTGDG